ncbi:hypothetical protein LPJ70_006753, partial [Coemansia sp. RSA 2708]
MQSIIRVAGRRLARPTRVAGRTFLSAAPATCTPMGRLAGQRTLLVARNSAACMHTTVSMRSNAAASSATESDLGDMIPMERIRNVGIIAHVDHGKTTLVDCLLKQSGALSGATMQESRVMDSNTLEKERGITILSKVTSLMYKDHRINIVDTPGHADFGGEVERILSMVDSVVLVVDASEGPMAQTKFVLTKALARGIHPLVVLNKIDRPTSRPDEVDSELLELFLALGATDEQTSYDMLYASAKEGWCTRDLGQVTAYTDAMARGEKADGSMVPLLEAILDRVPAPRAQRDDVPFTMLVTQLEANPYLGKCASGRISSGTVSVGDRIRVLAPGSGDVIEDGKVTKLFLRSGVQQIEMARAGAGDLVSISGVP